MFKKLLVFVCVLALAVGVFSMTAAAETNTDENAFKAGYAKVDINPWWSIWTGLGEEYTIPHAVYNDNNIMPLPMDGYNTGMEVANPRLALPVLSDDNGDGHITAGINSAHPGDGLQATCIAMQKGSNTLLLISVDMLRVDDAWSVDARQAVSDATGVPVDNIMISASHTHGGVNMDVAFKKKDKDSGEYIDQYTGTYTVKDPDTEIEYPYNGVDIGRYRDAYVEHVKSQLAEAAVAAMGTADEVTIARRGTIQANEYTGEALNSSRHYKQWYNTKDASSTSGYKSTKYVRGSNFNIDVNGDGDDDPYQDYLAGSWRGESYKSKPVSTADDSLHLLEFQVEGSDKPIVLVNWRAHAHTGTKRHIQYLSSDYIGSLRKALEDAKYRPAFFQGASGNLDNFDVLEGTTAWYAKEAATYAQRSVNYGTTLASAALALLNSESSEAITAPMTEVATGEIRTKKVMDETDSTQPYKFPGRIISEGEYNAAVEHLAETSSTYPCAHTVNGETYVFASGYHASSVKEVYEYHKANKSWGHTADINVLTVGNAIAFVTAPFELFDRYSMDATLDDTSDNDWDDLAQLGFGTPFVLTCTNEYWKYVPNNLAYHYGTDENGIETYNHQDTFALGCYESQTAYVQAGFGEALLEIYKETLTELSAITADCECCDTTNAQWLPLTEELLASGTLAGGHYYLTDDVDYDQKVTITGTGTTVCLDLKGATYEKTGTSGAFLVSGGATFNVKDSSGGHTGIIQGSSDCTEESGGVIYVNNATFSLYSGTLTGGHATSYGGNIFLYNGGTFNMYGGIVENGSVGSSGAGGNVCGAANSNFRMEGGMIRGGTVNGDANGYYSNVYAQGNVVLSDTTAGTEFLQLGVKDNTRITIDGTYTGRVNLWLGTGLTNIDLENYEIGGGINSPNISGAQISVQGYPNLTLKLNDDKLIFAEREYVASIETDSGTVFYERLQEAADAWWQMHNPAPIKLEQAAAGLGLHVDLTVDVELDLNGVQLTGLTVSGTGKVLCMDSTTDDYAVNDGYATVPAGSGLQAADGYMMIDDDGLVSFHKVQNRIYSINLRPSNVSLYYGSRFAGDEAVKANVEEYGIALRIGNAPTEGYITGDTENKFHVAFDREAWATGAGTTSSYGTLLYGIMTPGDSSNALYANANVYGTTYIKTVDGQMHLSEAKVFTLKQVVEAIDGMWDSLDKTQKTHIQSMYSTYKTVMSSWNIPNIRKAAEEAVQQPSVETDNTLKILAIGNSFSNDTTRLLRVIARAEGYENVMIGNLYYSGCNLNQHVEFAQNNDAVYRFYSNYDGQWTQEEDWTLENGLKEQDWDIITLQQGSVHSGLAQWYEDYLTQLIAYVNANKINPNAKLAWNMTWAYQADSTHDYFHLYENDQMTMYNGIINAVKAKVLPHGEFSYLIPAGTAIQNARTSYIGDTLTRDGYHLNDLGRVITAYTWFCTLIGADQLDEIKLDAIPAALTNAPASETDRVLTGIEKNVIMESVNNALAKPLQITQSRYTQTPTN